MTSRERINALINGSLPDRVPVFCTLLEQGAREMGMSIQEYYSRGEYVAEGQLKLRERYGYDQLWAYHYTALDAEILGSKRTIYSEDGPPNVGHLIIQCEQDIEKLRVDDAIFESPRFMEELKTLEILKREKGGECMILASVTGSQSLPSLLMGIENWMDLLYTGDKSSSRMLLEKCSQYCRKKIKLLFEGGVDLIIYFNPLGSASFVTPGQFLENGMEWVQKDIQENGPDNMVYFNGGGLINPLIDMLIENTGIEAYYINPLDDIIQARKIINGRALLAAPINDIPLIHQADREIEEEVRRIMDEGKGKGGFIFGTLVMPFSIPDHKIEVMLKAAYRYGTF